MCVFFFKGGLYRDLRVWKQKFESYYTASNMLL